MTVDADGALHECHLPSDASFSTGWSIRQLDLGDEAREVRHLAYHEARGLFVAATCTMVDFYFAEEDGRHTEQDGKHIVDSFHPASSASQQAYRSSLSVGISADRACEIDVEFLTFWLIF
jgi:hypothetical protein